ncbi:UNVERIFIED_CONTAM: putative E3 ubiquitin-protein ligase LIN [Sesamum indicum]
MSLEDLLAEEGFKRRKAKIKPRTSFASEGRGVTSYRGNHESGTLLKRTDRTRSEIPRYDSKGEFSISSSFTGGKPRDNLMRRGKIDVEYEKRTRTSMYHERRGHRDSWDAKRFSTGPSKDLLGSEITEVVESDEIVEVGRNRLYKDIYSKRVLGHEEDEESERHGSNIVIDDKETRKNSLKQPCSSESFKGNNRRSMKQPQSSDNRPTGMPVNDKNLDDSRSIRQPKFEQAIATPALDEVAVKAIISILNGYIKRFVKDEEFRTSLHHNSFASLNFIGIDDGQDTESKIIQNLEQAIETVERAAEETATAKELKRAAMQLSVITGLNSNALKDGFTSGIPNFKLSACAHFYLSVIYMLQKKDGIAAKHLLQVFCDSPFQARTTLLPELWENVFLPHLLHLKLWYNKESQSLADSPVLMNLRRLEKVYNESLDSGTYRFAMYYKDWITEGGEAPSVPLIKIPSISLQLMPTDGLHGHTSSPASHVSPQPMVSKKLYDEVFRHSHKSGVELQAYEEENFDVSAKSSNSPAPEDKQLILCSHDSVTSTNRNFEPDGDSSSVDLLTEDGDEDNAREMWLMSLSPSLLGDGKKSFLETVSKCLRLGNSDLVRVCLTTVAWLSSSLASLPDTEFQLLAFSALFPPLKQCLEHGKLVEHRILASLSLLNFSTIPECSILLKKIAEEIGSCLENLAEVTWTAKELSTVISRQWR